MLIQAAIAALTLEALPAQPVTALTTLRPPAPVENAHIHLFTYENRTKCWCGAVNY